MKEKGRERLGSDLRCAFNEVIEPGVDDAEDTLLTRAHVVEQVSNCVRRIAHII